MATRANIIIPRDRKGNVLVHYVHYGDPDDVMPTLSKMSEEEFTRLAEGHGFIRGFGIPPLPTSREEQDASWDARPKEKVSLHRDRPLEPPEKVDLESALDDRSPWDLMMIEYFYMHDGSKWVHWKSADFGGRHAGVTATRTFLNAIKARFSGVNESMGGRMQPIGGVNSGSVAKDKASRGPEEWVAAMKRRINDGILGRGVGGCDTLGFGVGRYDPASAIDADPATKGMDYVSFKFDASVPLADAEAGTAATGIGRMKREFAEWLGAQRDLAGGILAVDDMGSSMSTQFYSVSAFVAARGSARKAPGKRRNPAGIPKWSPHHPSNMRESAGSDSFRQSARVENCKDLLAQAKSRSLLARAKSRTGDTMQAGPFYTAGVNVFMSDSEGNQRIMAFWEPTDSRFAAMAVSRLDTDWGRAMMAAIGEMNGALTESAGAACEGTPIPGVKIRWTESPLMVDLVHERRDWKGKEDLEKAKKALRKWGAGGAVDLMDVVYIGHISDMEHVGPVDLYPDRKPWERQRIQQLMNQDMGCWATNNVRFDVNAPDFRIADLERFACGGSDGVWDFQIPAGAPRLDEAAGSGGSDFLTEFDRDQYEVYKRAADAMGLRLGYSPSAGFWIERAQGGERIVFKSDGANAAGDSMSLSRVQSYLNSFETRLGMIEKERKKRYACGECGGPLYEPPRDSGFICAMRHAVPEPDSHISLYSLASRQDREEGNVREAA